MGILNGKAALVTGGRRGIGRGVCLALAAEGADVAVNDVEGAEQAEAVAQEVRELGRRAVVIMADVAQPDQVQAMVNGAVEELSGLDILVNNAGVESIVPFLEITPEEWERVTNINLRGEFLCAQAAVRHMISSGNGGAIVNIGSVQAGMVLPGRAHYAPSKRGVEALTANLAVELAEHNIRVNCINPGLIDTDMTSWVMKDPEILPIVLEKIALKRAGEPDEIGQVAAFLASDKASYVTGQSLYVDGGFRIM
ncbi:MAG: glucose 1-dehydrogenase [Caldilineaceae bacterium]|nr:glucose 1-dehydrogenase [Caldilineaceae bacterium]MDE0630053.1 glucose 1-dehydrogenase [Caldilineaceae bacterium]MXZ19683.1 glucose 1-dehydrogenase [Caldilineaceae bacterium SB0665_bin_25]